MMYLVTYIYTKITCILWYFSHIGKLVGRTVCIRNFLLGPNASTFHAHQLLAHKYKKLAQMSPPSIIGPHYKLVAYPTTTEKKNNSNDQSTPKHQANYPIYVPIHATHFEIQISLSFVVNFYLLNILNCPLLWCL